MIDTHAGLCGQLGGCDTAVYISVDMGGHSINTFLTPLRQDLYSREIA